MSIVLETRDVTRSFGAVAAADHLNVQLNERQIVGIVGPNGSARTTCVNIVTGFVKPTYGQVLFRGSEVTGLPPHELTKLGITRSFQVPQLYSRLSIIEKTLIALSIRSEQHRQFWRPLAPPLRIGEALQVLERFGFRNGADQKVSTLPEGGSKLLDVALSIALQPALPLLDEPTSGISADEKFGVLDALIQVVKETGTTTVFGTWSPGIRIIGSPTSSGTAAVAARASPARRRRQAR